MQMMWFYNLLLFLWSVWVKNSEVPEGDIVFFLEQPSLVIYILLLKKIAAGKEPIQNLLMSIHISICLRNNRDLLE